MLAALNPIRVETIVVSPTTARRKIIESQVTDTLNLVQDSERAQYVLPSVSNFVGALGPALLRPSDRVTRGEALWKGGDRVVYGFQVIGGQNKLAYLGIYQEYRDFDAIRGTRATEVVVLLRRAENGAKALGGKAYVSELRSLESKLEGMLSRSSRP